MIPMKAVVQVSVVDKAQSYRPIHLSDVADSHMVGMIRDTRLATVGPFCHWLSGFVGGFLTAMA